MNGKDKNHHPFVFPFTTCEKCSDVVKHHRTTGNTGKKSLAWWLPLQPASFAINAFVVVALVVVAFTAVNADYVAARAFLLSVAGFEALHAFSHHTHIETRPRLQVTLVHFAIYVVTASFVLAVIELSGDSSVSSPGVVALVVVVAIDVMVFFTVGDIWTVITGLVVASTAFASQSHKIPHETVMPLFGAFAACTALFVALIYNEKLNCDRMLEWNREFPFHAMPETVSVVALAFLAAAIVSWQDRAYPSSSI